MFSLVIPYDKQKAKEFSQLMMMYQFVLDPISNSQVTMRLYRKVKNMPELRKLVMDGSLECCLLKPALIYDPFIISLAANKAVTTEKMVTKNVYTEIMFNLSISKNITPSLQMFGVGDEDTDVLVVTIEKYKENSERLKVVDGEEVPMGVLNDLRNIRSIQKAYKLKDNETGGHLLGILCNRVAIKDFT